MSHLSPESFHPKVWEKIKNYQTREQVEQAGLRISSMKITQELGKKLIDYINQNKLQTFGQLRKNGRDVHFLYAPHFSVKMYLKYDGSCSSCFIDGGADGYYGKWRHRRGGRADEYSPKAKRCMRLQEIYFAILKQYPRHLLDVRYITRADEEDLDFPF